MYLVGHYSESGPPGPGAGALERTNREPLAGVREPVPNPPGTINAFRLDSVRAGARAQNPFALFLVGPVGPGTGCGRLGARPAIPPIESST